MAMATPAPAATAPPLTPSSAARAEVRELAATSTSLASTLTPRAMNVSPVTPLMESGRAALALTAPPPKAAAAERFLKSMSVVTETAPAHATLPMPEMPVRTVPCARTSETGTLTATKPPLAASVAASTFSWRMPARMETFCAERTLPISSARSASSRAMTAAETDTPTYPPPAVTESARTP